MINKILSGEDSLNQNLVDTSSTESDLFVEQEGIRNIQSAKEKQKSQDLNQAKNLTTQLLGSSVTTHAEFKDWLTKLSREQLDAVALKAHRNNDSSIVQDVFLEIQNREYREKNKETINKSLDFLKDPLGVIGKKLDYYERNRLQKSDIKKDPIDRAKDFVSSFEERAVSEIRNLKGNNNIEKIEESVSSIIFAVGLLARDEKYKNIWQNAKNNIIEVSVDVLGYDFKNIEKFLHIKNANFKDFWFLMDHELSREGIGHGMVITPNDERYDPQSDVSWNPLEASLYILKKSPYLSYGVAKNLVGDDYESCLYDTKIFGKYINKYNN